MQRMGIDRELRVDAVADARRIGPRKRYEEATRLLSTRKRRVFASWVQGDSRVIPAKPAPAGWKPGAGIQRSCRNAERRRVPACAGPTSQCAGTTIHPDDE